MQSQVKINLALQAASDVVNKLKKIRAASGATSQTLAATRDQLRKVDRTAQQLKGFRQARANLRQVRTQTNANTEAQKQNRLSLGKAIATRDAHKATLQTARKALSKLTRALNNGKAKGEDFHREYARLGHVVEATQREFNTASSKVTQHTTKLRGLARTAKTLDKTQRVTRDRLTNLKGKLDAAGVSTATLGSSARRLRTESDSLNRSLHTQQNRLEGVASRQRKLQAVNRKTRQGMNTAVTGAAASMGYTYLAARGAGGAANFLETGADFEELLSKVQALSRLKKDDPRMRALEDTARNLGATTSFSATDVAGAQSFLSMAGFDPSKTIAAMPGLLDMAKAGDLDLAQSADISSNILGGFRLQAAQMARVADTLTKTFTTSNTTLQMLGDTMKYVGPVAASTGVGLEDVAAMAGLLGNVGIQGSESGTALRAMLLRLSSPTGAAKDALDSMGISAKDSNGNLRNMTDILEDLAWATNSMGDADKLEKIKAIFGERPAASVMELLGQASTGQLRDYIAEIANAAGSAKTTADVMSNNLRGDMASLGSAWADLKIQIFGNNNTALRDFVQAITTRLRELGAWAKANPETVTMLTKIAAGALVAVASMGALSAAIFSFLIPMLASRWLLSMLGLKLLPMLGKVATRTGGLFVAALRGIGSALMVVGRVALMNPIGLVITAIAIAVLALIKYWQPVKAFLIGMWGPIKTALDPFISAIVSMADLFAPLSPVFDWMGEKLGALWNWFSNLLAPIDATAEQLDKATNAGEAFGNFLVTLFSLHKQIADKFREIGGDIVGGLRDGIRRRIGEVKETVLSLGEDIKNTFADLLGIKSPSRVFMRFGTDTLDGYQKGVEGGQAKAIAPVKNFANNLIALPASRVKQVAPAIAKASKLAANYRFYQTGLHSISENNNFVPAQSVTNTNTGTAPSNAANIHQATAIKNMAAASRQAISIAATIAAVSALPVAASDVPLDKRAPISTPAKAPVYEGDNIVFNIYAAPGMDTQEIAQQIERALEERDRAKGRARRSALHD